MTLFSITLFNRSLGVFFEKRHKGKNYLLEIYLWDRVIRRQRVWDVNLECYRIYQKNEPYV